MTLASDNDDRPIRGATADGCRSRPEPETRPEPGPRPDPGARNVDDELQNLGTEAIEQLASGLNKAATTIQELGQNVRKHFARDLNLGQLKSLPLICKCLASCFNL